MATSRLNGATKLCKACRYTQDEGAQRHWSCVPPQLTNYANSQRCAANHQLPMVYFLFHLWAMGRKRFAIITFDPDRVEKLSWQGEGNSLAWIVWRGLCGWTYPKERGIINITLMDQLPAKPHPTEDVLE